MVTHFITKVAQIVGEFWGSYENHDFLNKTGEATFLGNFWKNLGYFLFQHLVTLNYRQNFDAEFEALVRR